MPKAQVAALKKKGFSEKEAHKIAYSDSKKKKKGKKK